METLQSELQQVREENNTLRFMLEVMSIKCTKLESQLQEIKQKGISSNQIGLEHNLNETSKRARLEFPTTKKPIQVFVRTHSNDDCLVCLVITTLLEKVELPTKIRVKENETGL